MCRRLFQQFALDSWVKIESNRLNWIRFNQQELRASNYRHLRDALSNDIQTNNIGRSVTILPSSYTYGPRAMNLKYHDAMAIVSQYGKPSLFATFTCNPKDPAITRELNEGENAMDRQDLIVRVFKLKVEKFDDYMRKHQVLGEVIAHVDVIEYQKRGLPHLHAIYWFSEEDKLRNIQDFDKVVTAELPTDDEVLFETIKTCMIHGPCGHLNPNAQCMKNGKCTKGFPKPFTDKTYTDSKGYPIYRRRNNITIELRKGNETFIIDNSYVVPYNRALSRMFNAHINIEICSTVLSCKYLFKYTHKGILFYFL